MSPAQVNLDALIPAKKVQSLLAISDTTFYRLANAGHFIVLKQLGGSFVLTSEYNRYIGSLTKYTPGRPVPHLAKKHAAKARKVSK